MKLKLHYYAVLREKAKTSEEIFESQATSPLAIYEEVKRKYGFHLSAKQIRFAVNDEFVSEDYQLKESDSLVFIPPVAGG